MTALYLACDGLRTNQAVCPGTPVATLGHALADNAARSLARGGDRLRGSFQATDRNFKAGHAFVAGHRRHPARTHGVEECDQFGAQRLVMSNGQMAHRVAAVRLEAKALGYLAGEKIAHDVFAAGGDGDAARLERG